jgi:hypothetical protein
MRILAWIVGVVVALVLAGVAIIVGIGFFLSPQDKLRHADVIVAVSGGETEQRTKEAIELYRSGYAPKLLFSGAAQDKNGPSNAAQKIFWLKSRRLTPLKMPSYRRQLLPPWGLITSFW